MTRETAGGSPWRARALTTAAMLVVVLLGLLGLRFAASAGADDRATATSTALLLLTTVGAGFALGAWHGRRVRLEESARLSAAIAGIVADGDPAGRLAESGDVAPLPLASEIDRLLEASLQAAAARVEADRADRERRVMDSHHQKQATERAARQRAEDIIVSTATSVEEELREVLKELAHVIDASRGITTAAASADSASDGVLRGAGASERALLDLAAGMGSVRGVTATITTITGKTHLLGLNAEIEAARAGAVGASFNIVAQEMRALAASTAASADEIEATIEDVAAATTSITDELARVTDGVDAVKSVSTDIRGAAARQRELVTHLISTVESSIERVRAMHSAAAHLDPRAQERVPVFGSGTVILTDTSRHHVDMRDLSTTGAQFEFRQPVRLTTGEQLQLVLPAELGEVPASASVVWARVRDDRTLTGVRFRD